MDKHAQEMNEYAALVEMYFSIEQKFIMAVWSAAAATTDEEKEKLTETKEKWNRLLQHHRDKVIERTEAILLGRPARPQYQWLPKLRKPNIHQT